jgi:hypothetical protein
MYLFYDISHGIAVQKQVLQGRSARRYRLVDRLRVGHFVGPTAAVQLLHERLSMVAGPSLGGETPAAYMSGQR